MLDRYYRNYIDGINIDEIEFKTFTYLELQQFFMVNYYDTDNNQLVCWNFDGSFYPFGMTYLEFSIPCKDNSYIVGLVKNNIGKETIVFCLEYNDNYAIFSEEEKSMAYITFIETNHYLKKRGILKKSLDYIKKQFRGYSTVVLTSMSGEGSNIDLFQRIVDLFEDTDVSVKEEKSVNSLIRRQ